MPTFSFICLILKHEEHLIRACEKRKTDKLSSLAAGRRETEKKGEKVLHFRMGSWEEGIFSHEVACGS